MQRRHPRLGEPDHPADLGEGQTLVVVEAEDQPLALGQRPDRQPQPSANLICLDRRCRCVLGIAVDGNRFETGSDRAVERPDRRGRHLGQPALQLLGRHPEGLGQLSVSRGATIAMLELGERRLDAARMRAHRARHPVELSQAVVDRTADPRPGEGLELDPLIGIEPLDRVDQTEHPIGDEVTRIDRGRQTRADTTGDELHQRRVVDDEMVARGGLPTAQPPIPVHRQLISRIHHPRPSPRRERRWGWRRWRGWRRRWTGHARGWESR